MEIMCKIALSISSIVRFLNVICKSIILKFNYKKRLTILNVDCDPNLNVLLISGRYPIFIFNF